MVKPSKTSQKNGSRASLKQSMITVKHPPQIQMTFSGSKTLRFTSTVAAKTVFTVTNVLDTLIVATSATTGSDLMESIRIKSIEMWAVDVNSSYAAPTTLTAEFVGNAAFGDTPTRIYSDTAVGPNEPAHLKCYPPANSSAGFWHSGYASDTLFVLNVVKGTIIDVTFDYVLSSDGYNSGPANPLIGATAGIIYSRGLDGIASASTKYPMAVGSYPAN
jgi:hypothetical protein